MFPVNLAPGGPVAVLLLGLEAYANEYKPRQTRSQGETCGHGAASSTPRYDWATQVLVEQLLNHLPSDSDLVDGITQFVDPQRGVMSTSVNSALNRLVDANLILPAVADDTPVWLISERGSEHARELTEAASSSEINALASAIHVAHAIFVAWSKTFRASAERRSTTTASSAAVYH